MAQDVVYIYHNQIDDRSEHSSENEVFNAYFSKLFYRKYGCTPRDFRKKH